MLKISGIPAFAVAMFYTGLNFANGNTGWFLAWVAIAIFTVSVNYLTTEE